MVEDLNSGLPWTNPANGQSVPPNCKSGALTILIEFPGSQIRVIPDPPSPRMPWENYTAAPSEQLPYVLCGAGASPVLCTRLGSKGSMNHKFSPFFNPTALPCWWAPIIVKQLSMTATARVIRPCTCSGTSQARGWCMCAPCLKFVLWSMHVQFSVFSGKFL